MKRRKLLAYLLMLVMCLQCVVTVPWGGAGTVKAEGETAPKYDLQDNYLQYKLTSDTTPGVATVIGYQTKPDSSSTEKDLMEALKKITVPDAVTKGGITYNVTAIDKGAFSGCSSMEEIKLGANVISIGENAFEGCIALKTITLSEKITSIGSKAFKDCGSLAAVSIPKTVTSIESSTFVGCKALTTVTLVEGLETIKSNAFNGCNNLKEIAIPASVKSIDAAAFRGCVSLSTLTIAKDNKTYNSGDSNVIIETATNKVIAGCLGTKSIPSGVTTIGESAFLGCEIADIKLPATLTTIEGAAFCGCKNLTQIDIPASVTSIGAAAFSECTSLAGITLPSGMKKIEKSTFKDCSKLISVDIPVSVTSIEDDAFSNCHTDLTFNGYAGSKAETFAKSNSIKFNSKGSVLIKNPGSTTPGASASAATAVKVSSVKLTGESKKIAAGKKLALTLEVLPNNATNKSIIWSTSNPSYATVTDDGIVTTKKAGAGKKVTITALAKDGSGISGTYDITIMKHVVKSVKITTKKKTVKAGKKLTLKTKVKTSGKKANKALKWTSSNEEYATVTASGIVKAQKAGKGKKVKITARALDGSGKKATVTIKIK